MESDDLVYIFERSLCHKENGAEEGKKKKYLCSGWEMVASMWQLEGWRGKGSSSGENEIVF